MFWNSVFAQALAGKLDPVSVVNEAVEDGVGEAEKSHQKAKASGYVECWTVVNVDKIDVAMARRESPSTNRFYRVSDLVAATGDDYQDFKDRVISLTGIPVQ